MSWGGGGGWDGQEELLWNAVSEFAAQIAPREREWDSDKLEKKLREYFKKGAKNLNFNAKGWQELIKEYTDTVASSIYMGLGDREWLPQADFLFCVDAAIKYHFPPQVLARVPQAAFEACVLQATDRSFDEQRYWTYRLDTIQNVITGKATQKKVREALDSARQEAVEAETGGVELFTILWIQSFARHLASATQGDPRGCVEEDTAVNLFQALVQEGALPATMVSQEGIPPMGWPVVSNTVMEAYAQFGGEDARPWTGGGGKGGGFGMGHGKAKGKGFDGWSAPQQMWEQDGSGEPPSKKWKGAW